MFSQIENFSQEKSIKKKKRTTKGFNSENSPNSQILFTHKKSGKIAESIASKNVSNRSAKIVFFDI